MAQIAQLALELIRLITDNLDDRQDLHALIRSNRSLERSLLGNNEYNQEQLQRLAPKSLEYKLACRGKIGWREALVNVLEREHNLATGRPVNITSFPVKDDFLYQDNTLLLLHGRAIHLYHIHSEEVRKFPDLFQGLPEEASHSTPRLVHFSSQILSVRLQDFGKTDECRLAIFRVSDDEEALQLLLLVNIPQGGSEVVRNDGKNAVVGTHTRTSDGYSWRFAWFSLQNQSATRLYEIGNFNSFDVGTNIVFEVVDDCFWVITSEITADPEGADPVSFYGGCRVNLSKPGSRAEYWRMWRRKQTEGPIHDSFTRLAFMKHEKEEDTYLVTESRAEWLRPEKWERSFYTTTFKPPPLEPEEPDLTRPLAYEDLAQTTQQDNFDCIETLLATAEDPNLTVFPGVRHRQMEHGHDYEGRSSAEGIQKYGARHLAYSAFHPQSNVWVDVVWDATSKFVHQMRALKGNHILRLQIGSRRAGPDYDTLRPEAQEHADRSELAVQIPAESTDAPSLKMNSPIFWHQPVTLFPSNDAHLQQLRRFEIPGHPDTENFKIFSDDRGIVLGLKHRTNNRFASERNVILINYDPMAKWGQLRQKLNEPVLPQDPALVSPQFYDTINQAMDSELLEEAKALGSPQQSFVLRLKNEAPVPVQYESNWEDEYADPMRSPLGKKRRHGRSGKKPRRQSSVSNRSDSNKGVVRRAGSTSVEVPCSPSVRIKTPPRARKPAVTSGVGRSKTQQKKRRDSDSSESTVYSPSGPFHSPTRQRSPESSEDEGAASPSGKRLRTEPPSYAEASSSSRPIAAAAGSSSGNKPVPQYVERSPRPRSPPSDEYGSDGEYPSSASEDRHHAAELFPEYSRQKYNESEGP